MSNDLTAKPSITRSVVNRAIHAKRPIFIWGPPGIGKSDIVEDITSNLPKPGTNEPGNNLLIDMRLALMEPTDLRGYPFRIGEGHEAKMAWAPPVDLPDAAQGAEYDTIVLFMDELNSAAPSVQAAAYQLILNRRVGEYHLPENVRIIAAGNRENDKGVTYRMPKPLANRFRHITMDVNLDDWVSWALNNDVHPDVVGYLSYAKGDLFDFNPTSSGQAFATPRSWTYVSEILRTPGFDSCKPLEQKIEVAGAVGEGMAAKFIEHRNIAADLPDVADVMSGKTKKIAPALERQIGALYSLVVTLTYEINELYQSNNQTIDDEFREKFNNTLRFAYANFQPEMVILLLKTVISEYNIGFQIRRDLEKDVYEVFAKKYTKYIV